MNVLELPQREPRAVERCWTIVLPRPRQADRSLRYETMSAAEQMFFFGAPLSHVVHYEEHLRAMRVEQAARRMVRARGPHNLTRGLASLAPVVAEPALQ